MKPPMRLLIAFALVAGGLGLLRNPSSNVPDFGARNSPTGFMAAGDGRSRPAARPDDSCWDAAGEKSVFGHAAILGRNQLSSRGTEPAGRSPPPSLGAHRSWKGA